MIILSSQNKIDQFLRMWFSTFYLPILYCMFINIGSVFCHRVLDTLTFERIDKSAESNSSIFIYHMSTHNYFSNECIALHIIALNKYARVKKKKKKLDFNPIGYPNWIGVSSAVNMLTTFTQNWMVFNEWTATKHKVHRIDANALLKKWLEYVLPLVFFYYYSRYFAFTGEFVIFWAKRFNCMAVRRSKYDFFKVFSWF